MHISRRSLLLATAGTSAAALATLTFGEPATASVPTTDWMASISPNTPLHGLTIPGTHDSGALYGGSLTQCQTLTIPEQLASGIRFLDVRCRAFQDSFYIHHGPVYQNLTFEDVLVACRNFLRTHRDETILMRVKQEHSSESNAAFMAIFNQYMDKRGWRNLFYLDSQLPRLGAVRGRIVLLGNGSGLPGISWGGPLTDIQDAYQVPTLFDREAKYQKVTAQAQRALTNTNPKLFINFTSGSSGGCWPSSVASYVNPRLDSHLGELRGRYTVRPALGVVPMDFPEADAPGITENLIQWNNGL